MITIRLPLAFGFCAALGFLPAALPAEPAAAPDTTIKTEARVDQLLARLTLDEKLSLLTGDHEFYIRAIPRLGLPAIKMADGSLGVRNYGRATAYPATVALAASWDTALGREYGAALGRDSRARGVHILLAPAVNIQRVPVNGRNFEYLSEDPFLAARMGVALINGIQSQEVVATVKHYAANNQEIERGTIDVQVSERALHEIYLPAFRAAVVDAKAWAVMDSYNRLNGPYTTASDWLNTRVLKTGWRFPGVVMSDWGAVHDTLAAMQGGLDLEMPGGEHFTIAKIKALLDSGRITPALVDDKVRRILRLEVANGFLDRPQAITTLPKDDPQSAATALQVAREGIVLLKNERQLLPLDRQRARTIVVLGPNAANYPAGGGSSRVQPFHPVSVLAALRASAGPDTKIAYLPGLGASLADRLLAVARYQAPLQVEFFNNRELAGNPVQTKQEDSIDHNWTNESPAPGLGTEGFSARWTGSIEVPADGRCTFLLQCDDGGRVFLDDQCIINLWGNHETKTKSAALTLGPRSVHRLRVEYYQNTGDAVIRFGWGIPPPAGLVDAAQVETIRTADSVVLCAGFNADLESEGSDRTYELPEGQAALIARVAGLNPRTAVVLNSGGSVATADWIAQVPALVQAWYPGQEGGRAVAEVLFGDTNPSGKLPFTFEKRWADIAALGNYPGSNGRVDYREDIFVGYRWFDHQAIEPRFPFGHGLSYTSFKYADPSVTPDRDGGCRVTFSITNTGQRAGAEVAQIYVAPPAGSSGVPPRAVRELKGFVRVPLAPGETRQVTVTLAREAFAYYDENGSTWRVTPGSYAVAIGASSRDLKLSEPFAVK